MNRNWSSCVAGGQRRRVKQDKRGYIIQRDKKRLTISAIYYFGKIYNPSRGFINYFRVYHLMRNLIGNEKDECMKSLMQRMPQWQ